MHARAHLVKDDVNLIVHRMHRVEDDVVERQEGAAIEALRVVLVRVLLHLGFALFRIHARELAAHGVKLRHALLLLRKVPLAAVAVERPLRRLGLPERLPGGHMRTVAERRESNLPVVRFLVEREVKYVGVAAAAAGRPEAVGVVRQQAVELANKGLVRAEYDFDENPRGDAVGTELTGLAAVVKAPEIGENVIEPTFENRVRLSLFRLLPHKNGGGSGDALPPPVQVSVLTL